MSAYAQMLTEKRANVWEQAKGLLDKAAEEKRELTAEENGAYDKMTEDLTDLRSQIDAHVKFDADNAAAEKALEELRSRPATGPVNNQGEDKLNDELRSFLRGEKPNFTVTKTAESRGIPQTGVERRALSVGSSTAGGNTVAISFYDKLYLNLILTAQLINAGCTVLQTSKGNPIEFPTVTGRPGAAYNAEAAAMVESDPAFGQVTLGAYKYTDIILVSSELIEDSEFDIASYLAQLVGVALGNAYGTDLVAGNGTNKAHGLITRTTLGKTGATGVVGAPSFDEMIDLYHSVISPYRIRPAASWLINDLTAAGLRKLKDTTGRYLWEPALTSGDPDRILGKPVVTDPNMPTTALNAKSVAFGDLSAYYARMAGPVRFEQSKDYAFNTDQVAFRGVLRGDGDLIDLTGAVKHFVGAAS